MAGISRSVTLTIAYIMAHFNLTMQNAYQYVKDKRPAISPNLNFMGQLVEFEQQCAKKLPTEKLDISTYFPTKAQLDVSAKLMEKIIRTGSTSSLSGTVILESPKVKDPTDSGNPAFFQPFVLKPLNAGGRRKKLKEGTTAAVMSENTKPIILVDSTEEGVSKSTVTETPSDFGFPRGRSTLPNQVDSSSPSNTGTTNICTSTSSTVESLEIESQLENESLPSSREGTPTKQLLVLSVKGERLTLKTREISNTSPERSSDDKECDTTRETEEDYRLHVQNN